MNKSPLVSSLVAVCLFCCCLSTTALAASRVVKADSASGFNPEGLVIDTIVIENRNINNSSQRGISGFVFRTARKLHFVTRTSVIRNELLFRQGEKFSTDVAEETARNLRARLTVNDAWILPRQTVPGHVAVTVRTIDQWSLVGSTHVGRDGNETEYRVGVEERNFLGLAQLLSFDYTVRDFDKNSIKWSFRNPRVHGYPMELNVRYNGDPVDRRKSIAVSHPFYNLLQRFSIGGSVSKTGGRHDEYRDSALVAQWQSNADEAAVRAEYQFGSYYRKLRLGLDYHYLYARNTDKKVFDTTALVTFPVDSTYHELGLTVGLLDFDFIVAHRINGFYYSEDIVLQKSVRLGFARALVPTLDDYLYNRLFVEGSYGSLFGNYIVQLAAGQTRWLRGSNQFRRVNIIDAHVYNTHFQFLTGVLRARYLSDWRADQRPSLTLGGKSGLRGYETHLSTGDRELLFNLEGRFFPGLEILSVLVGGVVFADIGRIWDVGESFKLNHFKAGVGVGLRLSFERLTRREMLRIDFALGQESKVEVSFGPGQFF